MPPRARVSIRLVTAVEFRMLRRAAGWPLLSGLLATAALLLVQEPGFARGGAAIPFVESGFASVLVGACLAIPLMWILLRRGPPSWVVVRPAASVVGWVAGITAFAVALAAISLIPLVTLDRISAKSALYLVTRLALATAPLAALAPALASMRVSGPLAAFAWLCVATASLGIFGIGVPIPADRVLGELGSTPPGGSAVAASVLSLLAGLSVSTAAVGRRRSSD